MKMIFQMKVNANDYGQQSVNEIIASRLHERLGWKSYVTYQIEKARVDDVKVPCSLNPLFTSTELELVSAYQLVKNYKIPNDTSNFEAMIQQAAAYGIEEREVRKHLEYTILTAFILTNTDRHFNNFGFYIVRKNIKLLQWHRFMIREIPCFIIKNSFKSNLLDIRVTSFCEKEVDMLRYVSDKKLIDLEKLEGFSAEAAEI